MKFNILNVKDFWKSMDYQLGIENDDGTGSITTSTSLFCYRVWIDNDFTFKTGFKYIYEIELSTGETWRTEVIEKGKDENGYFIVLVVPGCVQQVSEKAERQIFPISKIDINLVLSPDMIKGSDLLLSEINNEWPSFHETDLFIIKRTEDEIILRFSDGFLLHRVVDIIIKDIISETYDESLEYFTKQWLTGVEFGRKNNIFELRLYNDYTIEKEFKNHGTIQCKTMEFVVRIDDEKKRLLDAEYKEYLEGLC